MRGNTFDPFDCMAIHEQRRRGNCKSPPREQYDAFSREPPNALMPISAKMTRNDTMTVMMPTCVWFWWCVGYRGARKTKREQRGNGRGKRREGQGAIDTMRVALRPKDFRCAVKCGNPGLKCNSIVVLYISIGQYAHAHKHKAATCNTTTAD